MMRAARFAKIVSWTCIVFALCAAVATVFVVANQYSPPQSRFDWSATSVAPVPDDLSWTAYGADPGQTRYARIGQITCDNVRRLETAWTYRTGETQRRGRWARFGKFQAPPILAAGNLVFCTPFSRVVALDPATGTERWVFEPDIPLGGSIPRREVQLPWGGILA